MDPNTYNLFSGSGGSRPIEFIAGFTGSDLASGDTSVTFSGHSVGDLLIAFGATLSIDTIPDFTSGWTSIISFQNNSAGSYDRYGVVVYKFATSSSNEVLDFVSTSTSSTTNPYSAGYIFRNVLSIGASNAVNGTGTSITTSVSSPSLTLQNTDGTSALFLCSYVAAMTAAPGGLTVSNGIAYGLNKSTWSGGTMTFSSNVLPISAIVELKGT